MWSGVSEEHGMNYGEEEEAHYAANVNFANKMQEHGVDSEHCVKDDASRLKEHGAESEHYVKGDANRLTEHGAESERYVKSDASS